MMAKLKMETWCQNKIEWKLCFLLKWWKFWWNMKSDVFYRMLFGMLTRKPFFLSCLILILNIERLWTAISYMCLHQENMENCWEFSNQIECSKNRSALTIFSICRKVDSWRVVKCATCSRCRRQSNACKQLPVQVIISIQLGSHKTARIALCLSWFPVFYCCCRVTQVRTRSFKAFDCCTDVQTRWYCLTL